MQKYGKFLKENLMVIYVKIKTAFKFFNILNLRAILNFIKNRKKVYIKNLKNIISYLEHKNTIKC